MSLRMNTSVFPSTLILCLLVTTGGMKGAKAGELKVDFSREVLPVLSENCFGCHGPDGAKRKAGLRLDQHQGALALLESGAKAVVPGDSGVSAVYQRLTSSDPDEQMPPPDSGKSLSTSQIARIKQWIEGGAEWAKHWAFEPPSKPQEPDAVAEWEPSTPVDLFIHAALREAKLTPEDQADKETLIRRLALDLTGLPPTVDEIDTFLADPSDKAYERLVDRLLRSEKYGEHMARQWLDAARYADTHGLHLDNERSMWPYRDWVIGSFNRNQRFDEFTVEQLAGDLLPEPTLQQRVATGFNRCNVTTSEGGSIDDEYYARYAVDRVETTATVWLGLTAGCAACHDHKFDPLTQKEFYQLFSYFFSLTEKAMDGNALLPPPVVKVPSAEQKAEKTRLQEEVKKAESAFAKVFADIQYEDKRANEELGSLESADRVWIEDGLPEGAKPDSNEGKKAWPWVTKEEGPVYSGERSTKRSAEGRSQHFFTEATSKWRIGKDDKLFAYVYLDSKNPPETVQLQFNDGSWDHRAYWGADKGFAPGQNGPKNLKMGELPETGKWVRLEVSAESVGLKEGAELNGWAFTQFGGTVYWDHAGSVTVASLPPEQLASLSLWEQYVRKTKQTLPKEIQAVVDLENDKRNDEQRKQLTDHYLRFVNPETKELFVGPKKREDDLKKQLADLEKAIPATLIMEDRKEPRQAHILERGEYTEKREKVASNIPAWIAPAVKDAPANRLGLAEWLVAPNHPLTSRVTVNRFWQQFFGIGLVKTSEDFGVQGEQPSNPELLDWLAVDFVESGWDVKRFLKMLVMSSTYRQSSRVDGGKLAADPENRLLARGPRFRLDAEVIRDQALSVSGLLVDKTGGRSVKPYQPVGLWKPVGFGGSNTSEFKQDSGAKLYRRSMYTFWKRTSPPPTMATFDAPNRETCQVRRARTNTPLQALVLMNDVQFFEAARKFAEKVMHYGGDSIDDRVTFAFRSVLSRRPTETELKSLGGLYRAHYEELGQSEESVTKLLSAGESTRDESLDGRELATWTLITHLILNLSETVTKG
jgi:mono/diheme cytochrome c family protein